VDALDVDVQTGTTAQLHQNVQLLHHYPALIHLVLRYVLLLDGLGFYLWRYQLHFSPDALAFPQLDEFGEEAEELYLVGDSHGVDGDVYLPRLFVVLIAQRKVLLAFLLAVLKDAHFGVFGQVLVEQRYL
jgi:hypothetical protein